MFKAEKTDYSAIFDQRGASYDRAMTLFPQARAQEFQTLLQLAALQNGDIVCDVPAGGGYSGDFMDADVDLTLLETSETFFNLCTRRKKGKPVLAMPNLIPFPDAHFDAVLSLAGLHHNDDQAAFFRETARVLKRGGRLCLADVGEDSDAARFLNEFVDFHAPDGHDGAFLDARTKTAIEGTGLQVVAAKLQAFHWVFASVPDMLQFCGLLFGIAHLDPEILLKGIAAYVGYGQINGEIRMNWSLYYIRAEKPF